MSTSAATWTDALRYAGDESTRIIQLVAGGVPVGDVMWWDDEGPFYPHTHNRRFGAFETLAGAKEAVELRALWPVPGSTSGRIEP